jgi:prepilin-type N-terminal cleavage/methylation domain-containing protein
MTAVRRHSGFTLAELLAALAVMGVLMVALSSAMVIAARALPSDDRPSTRLVRGSSVLQQIADELAEAIAITERGAHAVAFIVADRDGDGAPERIRYAWDGTAGAPLTRSLNGGAPQAIAENVHAFDVAYVLRSVVETYPGPIIESAEQLFESHDPASPDRDYPLTEKEWIGQTITPALPAEALSWSVTRMKCKARSHGGTGGVTAVQIRPLSAGDLPTTTVLDEQLLVESTLPSSYTWVEFAFNNVSNLDPAARLCLALVLKTKDTHLADIQYDDDFGGRGLLKTNDRESKWGFSTSEELVHYVYGKYITPGPDQTATRRHVTAVELGLQIGPHAQGRVQTAARMFNEPEILRAFWELEAGQSHALDRNGDGAADFDATSSASGTMLTTAPPHDFTDLTTFKVRFRDTVAGDGERAWAYLNVDWSGTYCAPLIAGLELKADGTQTLEFMAVQTGSEAVALVTATGLSTGFVDLRLVVDPGLDTVNVQIDNKDYGTYSYGLRSPYHPAKSALFTPWTGGGAEFERVSVYVEERAP